MNDKTLMRISLAVSITGIVALFVFVQFAKPLAVDISRIDDTMLGQNVEVRGSVESFSARDGNLFLTVNDGTGKISVVMFERDAKRDPDSYALNGNAKNANISVSGKVSLYRYELEIVADSIEIL